MLSDLSLSLAPRPLHKCSSSFPKNYSPTTSISSSVPSVPPPNFRAVNLTSSTVIQLSWNPLPAEEINGDLQSFTVVYKVLRVSDEDVKEAKEERASVQANGLSLMLSVTPYSVYKIKIAASTQKGIGPFSEYLFAGKRLNN